MVTWADVDSAIESERQRRAKRVDSVTMATALLILICAIWLAWPTLSDLFSDKGVSLAGFGAPMLLLFWGIILQDLALDDPAARSRIGASTTVAWPVLMVIGALGLEAELNGTTAGSVLVMAVGWFCRLQSRTLLRGGFDVLRFRSILTASGAHRQQLYSFPKQQTIHRFFHSSPPSSCFYPLSIQLTLGWSETTKKYCAKPSRSGWMHLNCAS